MASLILGTTFTSLWLLRSRPDQVHDECMRGDPPGAQFIKFPLKFQDFFIELFVEKRPTKNIRRPPSFKALTT